MGPHCRPRRPVHGDPLRYVVSYSPDPDVRIEAARVKADAVVAAGEQSAADSVAAARDAVRRLRELLGGNAEVAQLCGITTGRVREYLTVAPDTQPVEEPKDAS